MIARWTSCLVVALVVSAGPTATDEQDYPTRPGVRVERAGQCTRIDAVVPGELLDLALPDAGGGRRDVVLLVSSPDRPTASEVEEEDEGQEQGSKSERLPPCPQSETGTSEAELRLYRLDPDGRREPELIHDDLPRNCSSVHAADVDLDGRDDLLVGCRDGLLLISMEQDPSEPERVLEEPGAVWQFLTSRESTTSAEGGPFLVGSLRLGALTLYGPSSPGLPWETVATIPLPLYGWIHHGGLSVRSPTPRFLGRDASGALVFVADPESVGPRRLRTLLIEAALPGEPRVTECWSGLPAPEDLLESEILHLDGRPVLFVTTKPEGKLNLFGEKFLRLYLLGQRDRSRLGSPPLFETESRMNLWQEAVPRILDVNGDGLEDLVVGYWKGLVSDRVVLDVYLREPDGSFRTSPKTTAFDIKDGDRDFLIYGTDIDGDDLPDLLVEGSNGLLLYPGRPSSNGKRVVSDRPRTIPTNDLPEGPGHAEVVLSSNGLDTRYFGNVSSRPRLVDLNGDGRPEILMTRRGTADSPAAVRVIRLAH